MGPRRRRPTDATFCPVLKVQLSQALEELGGQKQRADAVSPRGARGRWPLWPARSLGLGTVAVVLAVGCAAAAGAGLGC